MAAARYMCKKESIRASMMKLHFYTSSPYVHSSAFEPTTQGRNSRYGEKGMEEDYVVDTAKEGVRKATDIADAAGDAAKKTLDTAWESVKDANHKIRRTIQDDDDDDDYDDNNNASDPVVDEIQKLDGPVDTVEYRQMDSTFKSN